MKFSISLLAYHNLIILKGKNNIVNNIKSKDNIWNVNTEKVYSEEKS